ncbi:MULTISPECIES: DUF2442 domain-containing protein [Stenotrophomonas]|uniref:DUF2442 domain-containing protein n=1 Tax=Stenotrophomonas TaxID=40323 RepID=UPI000882D722|nr:DUF2442 domain-containing protein [Stenotrophomonas pavanii]SDK71148.1 hypothetical protein SAMN04487784_3094 [Stenotrophomonas pavanii]
MKIRVKSKIHNDVEVTEDVLKHGMLSPTSSRFGDLHATGLRIESKPIRSFVISFADRTRISLPVAMFPEFSDLKTSELGKLQLGFGGSAITLDERDLHVSIAGLVKASSPMRNLARAVTASLLGGAKGGKKASASRANGAKGGRPKKHEAVMALSAKKSLEVA